MTIKHFKIFCEVCKLESITLAASSLNMTQPAVSLAIKELEAFYNKKLFERMNRRIYITKTGNVLLQYANTVLSQFDESIQTIRLNGNYSRCRFGASTTVGETYLPTILKQLETNSSEVLVSTFVNNAAHIEKMIVQNEIDFAILDNVTATKNYCITPLYSERMYALCTPDYLNEDDISIDQLYKEKLLLREKGSGTRTVTDMIFASFGYNATPAIESTSTKSLIDCTKLGLGIAILPSELVESEMKCGKLKKLSVLDCVFERKYVLVYHKNKFLTRGMMKVLAEIERYFHQL